MIDAKRLRQKILDLAIRGKLVPQDPADEPAPALLERIHAEKLQMVADGKLKKKDVANDSVIYLGDDNLHYEKVGDGEPVCIEDELPFELPEGWVWTRLKSTSYGINYGVSNSAETSGSHRLLRITDIQNNKVNWSTVPYTTVTQEKAPLYSVSDDDILFARTGASVGKTYLACGAPDNAVYASYLIRVRLLQVLPRFLENFFGSSIYWEQITNKSVGIGQPNVNGTALSQLLIPIPSRAEQRRIVIALDSCLAHVDDIEQNQAELDELLAKARSKVLDLAIRGKLVPQDPADEPASVLLERIHQEKLQMVADGKLKKKDIAGDSVIYRGDDNSYYERHGSERDALLKNELYPIPASWSWVQLGTISNYGDSSSVSSSEIADDSWILDLEDIEKDTGAVVRRVTKAERDCASAKRPFLPGQLLYSKLRPYLNKVLVAPDEGYCTSEILPIRLYGGCDPYFVMAYFRSSFFLQYANHCSYGVKMPRLGTNDGRKAFIALPPIAEQRRISHAIESIQSYLASTR